MILTANQARELTENSDHACTLILEDISKEVQRIAEAGAASFTLYSSSRAYLANEFFKVAKVPCRSPEFTMKQSAVRTKLSNLGYGVKIIEEDIFVLDFDGNRVSDVAQVVKISW